MTKYFPPDHPGVYVKKNVIPKGLSVKKAAEIIGVGRPALSNFLNGKARLSQQMATRLEKAFNASKNELFSLQQEYDAFINKDEEKRLAVKSYTPSFLKISAIHIESWADKLEARSLLPALLRRLVNTSGGEIVSSDFPAYDQSQTPGWDGFVESENATPWIPSGVSGWEFGCNKNMITKANNDYKARLKTISKSKRMEMTFVFVTPRKWLKKDKWINEKKDDNEWKDIRAFDSGDIEQWLELSVPAQVWLAEQLGLPTSECQSLNEYWTFWSQTSNPVISPNIFKSMITDHCNILKNWYQSQATNPLIITASSKEEARAFFCCAVEQVDELKPLVDQAIFVSSGQTIKRLSEVSTKFVPVVYTDEAQQELVISFSNRHSIIIVEKNTKSVELDIVLELPNYESFRKALEEMGLDEAQIDIYANQSGHSPTILRRLLAKTPALKKTQWANSIERLRKIIPLVLAGSWSVSKEADKEILSCLANKNYLEIEKDITELVSLDDAPIWSEGRFRGVVSELECFYAISDYVTEEDIVNFFDLAEYVLSEDDPSLDLEKRNRWAANIYNKVRDHSAAIRENICQNLILLAVHGNALVGQRLGLDIEYRVSNLISTLLKDKDARVWQAQQSDLPQYAEAAPEIFLSIVEEELRKDKPAFEVLFEAVDSSIMFSQCDRTGMLWALELLAWCPSRLARVVKVLGKLSTYELDDNWVNKPINSLKDILLIWQPHTAASVEQRCEVLELLCREYPEVGWKICIEPLEPGSSMTSGTYRPRLRGDASGVGKILTHGEANIYAIKCLELVLSWPIHSKKTIKGLINCMVSMEEDDRKKVMNQVKAWVESIPDDEDIIDLREHVRTRTMTTHALIKNKKKGNNENYINGKELYELLEPGDLLLKHQWLFAESWVEYTPEELEGDNFDHDAREKGLEMQRISALREIVSERGIQGVLDLLKKSKTGHQIGRLLYNELMDRDDILDFIFQCLIYENSYEFGGCISGILLQLEENERNLIVTHLTERVITYENEVELIARLFIYSPFAKNTWDQLAEQSEETQNYYWLNINPWRCDTPDELNFSVRRLMEVNRPLSAFNLSYYKFDEVESDTIVELLNAIANSSSENDSHYKPSKYNIETGLKTLNERSDFDRMELVKLEYLYVDILSSHSSYGIPNLAKEISESPLLFMQLIAYRFKRKDSKEDPTEWNIPQDVDRRRELASKAYHVLDCINIIPGTRKDGLIDVSRLRNWVLHVRSLAKEHGREDILDQQIGKLLSTAKADNDDIWPREEIRIVFEEIGSPEISIGMEVGLYNSGGAEIVNVLKKKNQSDKYRKMAEKVMNKTPFVGRMLMNISKSYMRDAEHWEADHSLRKRLKDW